MQHGKPPIQAFQIKTACQGQYHVIELDPRGRLILRNHGKDRATSDKAMAELGLVNRCAELQKSWRDYFKLTRGCRNIQRAAGHGLPPAMAASAEALARRQGGHYVRLPLPPKKASIANFSYDPADKKYRRIHSAFYRTERFAASVFLPHFTSKEARYRIGEYVYVLLKAAAPGDKPMASASIRWYTRRRRRHQCLDVNVVISQYWYSRVYAKGLVLVDGYFVLDVPKPGFYLVAKPHRMYGLRPALMKMRAGRLVEVRQNRR